MSPTTMGEALRAAGVITVSPEVRMKDAARKAIAKHPGSFEDARWAFFNAIKDDAGVLWEMFSGYKIPASNAVLNTVAQELRDAAIKKRPTVVPPATKPGGEARRPEPIEVPTVLRKSNIEPIPAPKVFAPKRDFRAGMAAVSKVMRESMLDRVYINGQKIGDLTAYEARGWAAKTSTNVRFVQLLTANMPLKGLIRDLTTADRADEAYARALKETADAA